MLSRCLIKPPILSFRPITLKLTLFSTAKPPTNTQPPPKKKEQYTITTDPGDYIKFLFDSQGRCKIFEDKRGEMEIRWATRLTSAFTVLNVFLAATEFSEPMFGGWNSFAFTICMILGYSALTFLNVFAKRIVHKVVLHDNLKLLDITFFNAFWKPKTITFHISEFQYPQRSVAGYTRFELTSRGKIWVNLERNEFRNVKDYEELIETVFSGKPIENLFLKSKIKKQ